MLRCATLEDSESVATVLIEPGRAFLPFAPSIHDETDERQWVRSTLVPTTRVIAWEEDKSVVAVLAMSAEGSDSWIDQLDVLPGANGRGMGTKLLLHPHRSLSRPIRLYTFQEKAGARRFYERNGYKATAFTDGHGNGERCPDVLYVYAERAEEACPSSKQSANGRPPGPGLRYSRIPGPVPSVLPRSTGQLEP